MRPLDLKMPSQMCKQDLQHSLGSLPEMSNDGDHLQNLYAMPILLRTYVEPDRVWWSPPINLSWIKGHLAWGSTNDVFKYMIEDAR